MELELKISALEKIYNGVDGNPTFRLTIDALSFRLPSIVFLMGQNGSGKSVLLRLLAGEERPSQGRVCIELGDRKWVADKMPSPIVRQNVDLSLALDLSVRENLALHLRPQNPFEFLQPLRRLKSEIHSILKDRSELVNKLDQPCRYLSGGQKQALSFLAVSVRRFPILLLDEFLGATDESTSLLLLHLLSDYVKSTPACALIVTHDLRLALHHGDRILLLRSGGLVDDIITGSAHWDEDHIRNSILQN
jgi:putative ABC transport system ATP-binding protein